MVSARVRSISNVSSSSKGCVNPAFISGEIKAPELAPEICEPSSGDDVASRGQWGGKIDFMLTCIGFAVGLGNVWRFPYLCYKNGGGSFLIPYVIMLALVGMPMFFFELSFGQFSSLGPISVWAVTPILQGIGFCMVAISFIVALYYNVVITWAFAFLFRSFSTDVNYLPWMECGNWSTALCFSADDIKEINVNETFRNITMGERNLNPSLYDKLQTPSQQYFYRSVLNMSESMEETGAPVWHLVLTCALVWTVVFFALLKGVSSLGKVMYFVTTFPYIMMTAFVINGAMLEGAGDGIKYYLTPDWEKLQEPQVWADAATQLFFSLSACTGGLIAMGSFNDFKNNCYRDSLLVPIINCCTSVFAGFAVFAVLGHMAKMKGVDIADVAEQGPGLVFVVYPEAISTMTAPVVWAVLFFVMLILLGFSSSFSIMETVFVAIMDEFPHILRATPSRPIIFRGIGCLLMFLLSIPMLTNNGYYVFEVVEFYSGAFPLLIIALFELISISWIYGMNNFASDIEMMLGHKPNLFFRICWRFITPAILFAVLVSSIIGYEENDSYIRRVFKHHDEPEFWKDGDMPIWATAMGWLVMVFIVMWIPIVAMYKVITPAAVKAASSPSAHWHPALEENCLSDKRYTTNNSNVSIDNTRSLNPLGLTINTTPKYISNDTRVWMNTPPVFPSTPPAFPVQPVFVVNGMHNSAFTDSASFVMGPPSPNGVYGPPSPVIFAQPPTFVYAQSSAQPSPPAYTPSSPVHSNTTL